MKIIIRLLVCFFLITIAFHNKSLASPATCEVLPAKFIPNVPPYQYLEKEGKLRIRIIVTVLHKDGETTSQTIDEKTEITNPWDAEVIALAIVNEMYKSRFNQCEKKECRLTK